MGNWTWTNKARSKTHSEIINAAFKPSVVGRTGGRPAFSLFQMYRCMILNPGLVWHGMGSGTFFWILDSGFIQY